MAQPQQLIVVEACSLAKSLPYSLMQTVALSVESCDLDDWTGSRSRITGGIAHAHYRNLVDDFLDCWKTHAVDISPEAVSAALRAAAYAEKVHGDQQSVELVWAGP
ncbi:MAG: hypothetical protein ACC645_08965, partial [Pirellulales bacterium]